MVSTGLKVFLSLLLIPAIAGAAANDLVISQRNATDTGANNRILAAPAGGANGILYFNASTVLPAYLTLGTNLSITSGVLNASSSSQVNSDWNSVSGVSQILNKPSISTVGMTGQYGDLIGSPSLSTVATSGAYSDLSGKPSLGTAASLNVAASGDAASGEVVKGNDSRLTNTRTPTAHTHASTDINDSTSIGRNVLTAITEADARWYIGAGTSSFSGAYGDLTGTPSTFTPSAHNQAWSTITSTPTTVAGYAISDAVTTSALTSALSSYATSSALTTGLAGKFNTPTGTSAQYLRGDGSTSTFPTALSSFTNDSAYVNQAGARSAISLTTTGTSGAATYNSSTGVLNVPNYATSNGTVTGITAGTGLSGGTITTTGTISLPNTGTAGTYSGVTTDAQGRVTSGTTLSINDSPGRSLVTSTSATGFQISATRAAYVCYEGAMQTTSTIGGPASGSVFIETANTNSTTPGDWTKIAEQTASNTITLAVVLQQVDGEPWSLCRMVAAGKYVRVRSQTNNGTVTFTINSTQQEVQM